MKTFLHGVRPVSLALAVLLLAPVVAGSETLVCPSLEQTRQVNACPTDEQLRVSFLGFCSDDNKAYQGQTDPCTDFERFRRWKNTALWESADGVFGGYRSCEAPAASATLARLQLDKKGPIQVVQCAYSDGTVLSHRTRKTCTLPPTCASDPSQCQASCAD